LVLLGDGDGLSALHRALGTAMQTNGLKAGTYFVPHVTLSYGPWAIPLEKVGPIRFVADHFSLVHSLRGLTRYEVLGRWLLRHRRPR
jgi:2'-5' RNA ligase